MPLHDIVGKSINEPIKSNNSVGDVRLLWGTAQQQSLTGQTLTALDGTTLGYTLLYYIPGLTTWCAVGGAPILTGYMSGCYLFRYKVAGQMRVAHVGTDDTKADWSKRAKDAWKALAAGGATEIMGYDPINDISDDMMQRAVGAGTNPQIIGAWEANGAARVGMVVTDTANAGKRIIVGFEHAPLRSWREIQNDVKMA